MTRAAPARTLHTSGRYGDVGLTGLEVASGLPLGAPEPVALPATAGTPLAELERSLLVALRRPPCLVAFSGGRDSSALLAVATRVADREGLDRPVAATQRFPGVDDTAEERWQELVIGHLGIAEWVRIEQPDGLDILGPVARGVLARHGPIYPMNAHFGVPLLEHASGGTVVTGLDGDTLFGGWRWTHIADVLQRRTPPRPRDAVTALHRKAPQAVQDAILRRTDARVRVPWLTEAAQLLCGKLRARSMHLHPERFDRYTHWFAGSRHVRLLQRQLELLAHDAGAAMIHPFMESNFLSALGRWGGRHGPGDRTAAMRALFCGLLPDELLARRTKARFDPVFLGSEARAFGEQWDGSGVEPELVDADGLRAELARPMPRSGVGPLLQWLWLARQERT